MYWFRYLTVLSAVVSKRFLPTVLSAEDKRQRECLLTKFDGLLKVNKESRNGALNVLMLKTLLEYAEC